MARLRRCVLCDVTRRVDLVPGDFHGDPHECQNPECFLSWQARVTLGLTPLFPVYVRILTGTSQLTNTSIVGTVVAVA